MVIEEKLKDGRMLFKEYNVVQPPTVVEEDDDSEDIVLPKILSDEDKSDVHLYADLDVFKNVLAELDPRSTKIQKLVKNFIADSTLIQSFLSNTDVVLKLVLQDVWENPKVGVAEALEMALALTAELGQTVERNVDQDVHDFVRSAAEFVSGEVNAIAQKEFLLQFGSPEADKSPENVLQYLERLSVVIEDGPDTETVKRYLIVKPLLSNALMLITRSAQVGMRDEL